MIEKRGKQHQKRKRKRPSRLGLFRLQISSRRFIPFLDIPICVLICYEFDCQSSGRCVLKSSEAILFPYLLNSTV
jgi:hypothetical protein